VVRASWCDKFDDVCGGNNGKGNTTIFSGLPSVLTTRPHLSRIKLKHKTNSYAFAETHSKTIPDRRICFRHPREFGQQQQLPMPPKMLCASTQIPEGLS
jgi:hypothetical protein